MKKKIAIIHPQLKLGGSEVVTMWMVQVLKDQYEVTLISMGEVDLQQLNIYYGTKLQEDQIQIIALPIPWLFTKFTKRFDALRGYSLARFCKKVAPQFDVMISTYNVMDFGKPGIQCIADFSFDDDLRRKFDGGYKRSWMRSLYLAFARWLSGQPKYAWKKNLTIANSVWTKNVLKQQLNIDSTLVYPPVFGSPISILWEQKKDGFVFLGRISSEKRIEDIIDIIRAVRKQYPQITLHIVGPGRGYHVHEDWCFFEGPKYGQEKWDFISQYKYGISARPHEPFGIAVAEMVKSGCIVFTPNGGGQVEIIDSKDVIYTNKTDAIVRIKAMLGSPERQAIVREHILEHEKEFSIKVFAESINAIIQAFQPI